MLRREVKAGMEKHCEFNGVSYSNGKRQSVLARCSAANLTGSATRTGASECPRSLQGYCLQVLVMVPGEMIQQEPHPGEGGETHIVSQLAEQLDGETNRTSPQKGSFVVHAEVFTETQDVHLLEDVNVLSA